MAFRNLNGRPFTFANRRFHTDDSQGFEHVPGAAKGSFFGRPLQSDGGYRLYLEHVVDRDDEQELALVWYDPNGAPTTTSPTTLRPEGIASLVAQAVESDHFRPTLATERTSRSSQSTEESRRNTPRTVSTSGGRMALPDREKSTYRSKLLKVTEQIAPHFNALCPTLAFPTDEKEIEQNVDNQIREFLDSKHRITARTSQGVKPYLIGMCLGFFWTESWQAPPSVKLQVAHESGAARRDITRDRGQGLNTLEARGWRRIDQRGDWTIIECEATNLAEAPSHEIAAWLRERFDELEETGILGWVRGKHHLASTTPPRSHPGVSLTEIRVPIDTSNSAASESSDAIRISSNVPSLQWIEDAQIWMSIKPKVYDELWWQEQLASTWSPNRPWPRMPTYRCDSHRKEYVQTGWVTFEADATMKIAKQGERAPDFRIIRNGRNLRSIEVKINQAARRSQLDRYDNAYDGELLVLVSLGDPHPEKLEPATSAKPYRIILMEHIIAWALTGDPLRSEGSTDPYLPDVIRTIQDAIEVVGPQIRKFAVRPNGYADWVQHTNVLDVRYFTKAVTDPYRDLVSHSAS